MLICFLSWLQLISALQCPKHFFSQSSSPAPTLLFHNLEEFGPLHNIFAIHKTHFSNMSLFSNWLLLHIPSQLCNSPSGFQITFCPKMSFMRGMGVSNNDWGVGIVFWYKVLFNTRYYHVRIGKCGTSVTGPQKKKNFPETTLAALIWNF